MGVFGGFSEEHYFRIYLRLDHDFSFSFKSGGGVSICSEDGVKLKNFGTKGRKMRLRHNYVSLKEI